MYVNPSKTASDVAQQRHIRETSGGLIECCSMPHVALLVFKLRRMHDGNGTRCRCGQDSNEHFEHGTDTTAMKLTYETSVSVSSPAVAVEEASTLGLGSQVGSDIGGRSHWRAEYM